MKLQSQADGEDTSGGVGDDDSTGGNVSILVVAIIDSLQKAVVGNSMRKAYSPMKRVWTCF